MQLQSPPTQPRLLQEPRFHIKDNPQGYLCGGIYIPFGCGDLPTSVRFVARYMARCRLFNVPIPNHAPFPELRRQGRFDRGEIFRYLQVTSQDRLLSFAIGQSPQVLPGRECMGSDIVSSFAMHQKDAPQRCAYRCTNQLHLALTSMP